MKLIPSLCAAATLCLGLTGMSAHAQTPKSDDQIKSEYNMADKACDAMKGDQKDACQARAKATRDSAMADSKLAKKEAEARHDAMKDKNDAAYKAARAECDTMSGNAKDACTATAKTKYNK